MSHNTYHILSNLHAALDNTNDEFTKFLNNGSPASDRIAAAIAKKKELAIDKAVEDAADEIIHLESAFDSQSKELINSIREMRRAIKKKKDELKRMSVSLTYARQSMNYIPLAVELKIVKPTQLALATEPIFTVPPLEAEKILQKQANDFGFEEVEEKKAEKETTKTVVKRART